MAYVVWRVFMKKYSKVRLGLHRGTAPNSILNDVTPAKSNVETHQISESWKKTAEDESSSASLSTHRKPSEISLLFNTPTSTTASDNVSVDTFNTNVSVDTVCERSTTVPENEQPRRSKSRVRSYLKRCKDAIIGINMNPHEYDEPRSIASPSSCDVETKTNQATSSWYVNELLSTENEVVDASTPDVKCELDNLHVHALKNYETEMDDADGKTAAKNVEEIDNENPYKPLEDENDVANLVDAYLAALYPNFFESTRAVLLRQARDLLICTFHADLSRFEREFLSPAAKLIEIIKNASYNLSNTVCPEGWPLSIYGTVVLHLGTLDESFITTSDIYLCIKIVDSVDHSDVHICAAWRSFKTDKIVYHILDPDKESLTSISLEMLTEELPQLLQTLLVSVEQTINGVSFDELAFPQYTDEDKFEAHRDATGKPENRSTLNASPKCGLKRREIITKNKSLHSRYALRRLSNRIDTENRGNKDISSATVATTPPTSANTESSTMPLFCLGGSFPHIDSDEDSGDDGTKSPKEQARLHHDIVAPRSITDLPEKLLTSGVYLSDTHDVNGSPIITIESGILLNSGLNCYEIATIILYYNKIPMNSSTFTVHTIITDNCQLSVLHLIDNSLHLLHGHVCFNIVLVSTLFATDKLQSFHLPSSKVKIVHAVELFDYISPKFVPKICNGLHVHNQALWREFFVTLELLQNQCISCGQDLVAVMNEIRLSDGQGMPSRRQLYSQHRALSRALMDSELQCLRRKGEITITRLQSLAYSISSSEKSARGRRMNESENKRDFYNNDGKSAIKNPSEHVSNRLAEVTAIFVEVDRAARRLEQLTEQRRERLREITRQKALEEEMNEVITWIQNNGEDMLKKFTEVPLDSESSMKDYENDFEKFYFISMKHLAKGRDLGDAALNVDSVKELRSKLKQILVDYGNRLENIRERIEGAARLHHLLTLELKEKDVQQEMHTLAEKIGVLGLIERCRDSDNKNDKNMKMAKTSTPTREPMTNCSCWRGEMQFDHGSREQNVLNRNTEIAADDDEDHSKMADSGLGGCDRCEGNDKLTRTCSCQSFDEPTSKSHNSDDMEEDCFENNSKEMLDYQLSPLRPNAHLYSYSSNLALPDLENSCGLAPKTQKTLLLIIREMIGTERDYVRSLHYIIDNYMEELNREDIPQALRGQRNVIFGNVEKICEFHQQYFLNELERCENNPLKIGAVFLEHESKFYLYALYNKNKPKSDTLMSEYGSSFFKAKQIELEDKMDLASYLLKPVQRMGKYALLLQQLMKAVTSIQGPSLQEISEDIEELQKAEEMVRFQLRHGNDLLAMDSLRDCDVNVKEQGRLLRQNEFLVWQGRGGKKSLRQVFLFEDLVLFSKARRFPDSKNLDIYLYKNSIKTSDIGLTAFVGDSTTKFEIWFRKRKPDDTWTLQSMNEDIKNAWTEEISKLLWKQAKRNRDIRMAEMSSMGIGNKPCLDIRPSQNQINDRSITFSQLEKAPKFRNSFSGALLENTKVAQRPNSIISLGSSFSSGTSRSSLSTSTTSSSSISNARHTATLNMELDMINESLPLKTTNNSKKHQRSTTLVSQLSMESGIIADMSTSPDNETQPLDALLWPNLYSKHKSQAPSNIQKCTIPNTTAAQKSTFHNENDNLSSNSTSNPYINNDSIAVHL